MNRIAPNNRHKWIKDQKGKHCEKCGSRINETIGFHKYVEIDKWGVAEYVNWYPRCFSYKKQITH